MLGRARRKVLGAYYTPEAVIARALEGLPPPPPGALVADLSCGDGGWLEAARARWPGTRLFGVEIDPRAAEAAARRLPEARIVCGDGLQVPVETVDVVLGNPPWGAGRQGAVRRGAESASAFVERALGVLRPDGRLCLILPAAWLEVAAHRAARAGLLAGAAIERLERLGDVFPGVVAPAARVQARREPDPAARAAQVVATPRGPVRQAELMADPLCVLEARLSPEERALARRLDQAGERLRGRVTFVLGVVTGDNRRRLGSAGGEPIVVGTDVSPHRLAPPARRLLVPLEAVQQAAPRALYARPKVVYRFIAAAPIAAHDRRGQLTLNSANALVPDRIDPDYLVALLNSAPVRFAHRARVATPRVLRAHLERLPLPRAGPAERRVLARLSAEQGAGAAEEIDARVARLFGLDAKEARLCRRS